MNLIDGILNGVRAMVGLQPLDAAPTLPPAPAAPSATPARSIDTSFESGSADTQTDPPQLSTAARRALEAMRHDSTAGIDEQPTTTPSPSPTPSPTPAPAAMPRARATVRDASRGFAVLGTTDTLDGTTAAGIAARNVQAGLDYYATTFGRNGLDGAGSGVDVDINDMSTDKTGKQTFHGNGGYYKADHSTYEAIHYGDGTRYTGRNGLVDQASMSNAGDLAIHELTHGIIRKETGYLGGGADEAGATNEAIADIMAASATRDWTLGEGMYTADSAYKNMRNIANPNDPTSVHGLWTSMGQVRTAQAKNAMEEHWASGVLSTAAYRVQQRIGGEAGWDAVQRVFYDVIDTHKLGNMSFAAVASGARAAANELYGAGSTVSVAVDEELRRGGL